MAGRLRWSPVGQTARPSATPRRAPPLSALSAGTPTKPPPRDRRADAHAVLRARRAVARDGARDASAAAAAAEQRPHRHVDAPHAVVAAARDEKRKNQQKQQRVAVPLSL